MTNCRHPVIESQRDVTLPFSIKMLFTIARMIQITRMITDAVLGELKGIGMTSRFHRVKSQRD